MKKAVVPSILVAVVLLALGVTTEAQQPKKVPRIGYLSAFDRARESSRTEAIRLGLRELGYIEGQNIATEYRYAAGKIDRPLSLQPGCGVGGLVLSGYQAGAFSFTVPRI